MIICLQVAMWISIVRSLDAAWLDVKMVVSLCNLNGILTVLLSSRNVKVSTDKFPVRKKLTRRADTFRT